MCHPKGILYSLSQERWLDIIPALRKYIQGETTYDHPWLHSDFGGSLGYMKVCDKKKQT